MTMTCFMDTWSNRDNRIIRISLCAILIYDNKHVKLYYAADIYIYYNNVSYLSLLLPVSFPRSSVNDTINYDVNPLVISTPPVFSKINRHLCIILWCFHVCHRRYRYCVDDCHENSLLAYKFSRTKCARHINYYACVCVCV